MSPEEYLARERAAEAKSEYMNGTRVAMTGASRPHNLITLTIGGQLYQQLRGRLCEAYVQEMRVRSADGGAYIYPAGVVVCEPPEFEDDTFDALLNPTVVIEVLSPSTAAYDRGRRRRSTGSSPRYASISSWRRTERTSSGMLATETRGCEPRP